MANNLRTLILAILNIIREHEGNATKTKLLKLLYLADIEHFRDTKEILTGARWVYHLYGPWFEEYDAALSQCEAEGLIAMRKWSTGDLDGISIEPRERATLDELGLSLGAKLSILNAASLWAAEPTGELLNYVYFHTEPMIDSERGKPLNFAKVRPRKELQLYRRTKSGMSDEIIHKARKRILEAHSPSSVSSGTFTPPNYDDQFVEGILSMQEEVE